MYKAFKTGRSESNPADFWAQGEIGFFDFYIIPLAKKLKDCGVFGVSYVVKSPDDFLNYAVSNRADILGRVSQLRFEKSEGMVIPWTGNCCRDA